MFDNSLEKLMATACTHIVNSYGMRAEYLGYEINPNYDPDELANGHFKVYLNAEFCDPLHHSYVDKKRLERLIPKNIIFMNKNIELVKNYEIVSSEVYCELLDTFDYNSWNLN